MKIFACGADSAASGKILNKISSDNSSLPRGGFPLPPITPLLTLNDFIKEFRRAIAATERINPTYCEDSVRQRCLQILSGYQIK